MARARADVAEPTLPDEHPPSPEPTPVGLTCCNCGKPIDGVYIHAKSVVAKSPGGQKFKVIGLARPTALCHQCASSGVNLTVDVEWRQVAPK